MIGQSFGVGTHAEMPVALAGAVYSVGASAIWFQWKNLFITPFYWLMAPVFRRIRRTTMAEFTEDRYGLLDGRHLHGLCAVLLHHQHRQHAEGRRQSHQPGDGRRRSASNEIVVAMTVMFILYSFVGGLIAAAWTDLFQGVLIIVLSFMLIPLGMTAVGGMDGIAGVPRAVPLLAGHAIRHRAVGDRDADCQRPGRDHGAAAPAGGRRHRAGRAHLPRRHVLRQHGEARVHGRLGAGRADRRGDGRPGAADAARSPTPRMRSASPAASCCFPACSGC